jgi:transglutaminase-like putative cysteine protease
VGPLGTLPGPNRVDHIAIPAGIGGVQRTLRIMVDVAATFKTDVYIRTLAVYLVGGRIVTLANGNQVRYPLCRPKDYAAELGCIHAFVRDHIRYVRDIDNVETLQTPIQTLNVLAGDCDDKAVLFCALAGAIGFPTRFAALAIDGGPFSHVLAQALLGDQFITAETILTDPPVELGWEPPDATDVMFAHVE